MDRAQLGNTGDASFDERAIGSLPWLDDNGAPVENLFGAFGGTTQLNTNNVSVAELAQCGGNGTHLTW